MGLPDSAIALRAIASRDARFDGSFWFGVTSTGIYCRPTCPARRPRDENVRFFASPAAAVSAGFRACRRCRPEIHARRAAPGSLLASRALELITEGVVDDVGVSGLASRLGVSERQLHRTLVGELGATAGSLAQSRRAQTARALLTTSQLSISDVAFAAGFASLRTFNDIMLTEFGATPKALRSLKPGHGRPSTGSITLRLKVAEPYDSTQVRRFLSGRCVSGLEQVVDDTVTKALALPHGTALVSVRLPQNDGVVLLRIEGGSLADLGLAVTVVRRWLDLDVDPVQIGSVLQQDDFLAAGWASRPGLRVPTTSNPWETLVRTVIGQQVSITAARTILGRLVERLGTDAPGGYRTFPSPDVIAGASELAGIGMPNARAATLIRLGALVAAGELDFSESLEDVQAKLGAVKGVGPWTVSYFSMRGLGDPDAFPAGDLGIKQSTARLGLTTAGLIERSQRWRPWRTYATQLIWEGLG